jgi:hypothetical protein
MRCSTKRRNSSRDDPVRGPYSPRAAPLVSHQQEDRER